MTLTRRALALRLATLWVVGACAQATEPVDRFDRSDVVRYYHEVFQATEDYDEHHGWTGSISGCNPGTVSVELHTGTINRVNYFRAMAGLPSEITLSSELNAKCQQAALMMARNNDLSHTPSTSWPCYTADGAEAALMSNLSLGFNIPHYGPAAVVGQMEDGGASNIDVAHRRWILSTEAPDVMGHGSIPLNPVVGNPSLQNAAMALWVTGESTQPLPEDFEFVAWPPAGFVPYDIAFGRWSFGIPGADFSNANVTVSDAAGNLPTTIVHRVGGAGDPTIVFEPAGFPLTSAPEGDPVYTVTVSGIESAPQSEYSYQVTIIDPNSMPPIDVSGSDTAYVGHPSRFEFSPFKAAAGYQMRVFETSTGEWSADAETADAVIDDTRADHSLRTTSFAHSGSRSFQMVWDGESFEVDRTILPSESSVLHFEQRFRWVGNTTSLIAEVSSSSGGWSEVWRRTGSLQGSAGQGDWEASWNSVTVPLSEFAGETVRLRFRYQRDPGGYGWFPDFPGDQFHEFGALVDDIDVTDDMQIEAETVSTLDATVKHGEFTPPTTGSYKVQFRAQIADIWFGYSLPHAVEAQIGTPPTPLIELVSTGIDATGAFYIDATASNLVSLAVQTSTDGGGTWIEDESFAIPAIDGAIRLTSGTPASGTRIFRLSGQ